MRTFARDGRWKIDTWAVPLLLSPLLALLSDTAMTFLLGETANASTSLTANDFCLGSEDNTYSQPHVNEATAYNKDSTFLFTYPGKELRTPII